MGWREALSVNGSKATEHRIIVNPTGPGSSWEVLQLLIERHAHTRHSLSFYLAVAEAILRVDRQICLPEWLLHLILVIV